MANELNELRNRLQALEDFVLNTKLPVPESAAERSIWRLIIDMEHYVRTLFDDPPINASRLNISMKSELDELVDERIKMAMSLTKGIPSTNASCKCVLRSAAMQEIEPVVDP